MLVTDVNQIKTIEQLRSVVVTNQAQDDNLADRLYDHIDEYAQGFIADSPLVFFATAGCSGHVDVSPKGDAPGFIEVQDKKTLLFPERMGNTDARNLRNILENDQVSLVFVIPRTKDVLRVTGKASITKDPELLDRMASSGRPAQLCIRIDVQECFFHCSRAFNRSHIWNTDKWPESEKKYMRDQITQRKNMTASDYEKAVNKILHDLGEADGAY